MLTIRSNWEDFRKKVIAADAPLVQKQEMMMAFYAGAAAMLSMQIDLAGLSENAALAVLEGLHQEIDAFTQHVAGL